VRRRSLTKVEGTGAVVSAAKGLGGNMLFWKKVLETSKKELELPGGRRYFGDWKNRGGTFG